MIQPLETETTTIRHEAHANGDPTAAELMALANEGRDKTVYHWRMDAAKMAKVESLMSIMRDLKDGMVIVDAGSGTGAVLEAIAEICHQQNIRIKPIALDISHEHVNLTGNEPLLALAFGDAAEQNFPPESVDVMYFSTCLHEISSFGGGLSRLETALNNAYAQLRSDGQLIIRDFVKPDIEGPIFMQLPTYDGEDVGLDVPTQDVDYNTLSTMAKFKRFHSEFQGGNAFPYEEVERGGQKYIKIAAEWAYDFYMRKEYTGNWRNEIKEQYHFWTMKETKQKLEAAGFVHVEVRAENSEYMVNNWLKGKIGLFTENDRGQLEHLPFPPTHMLASGRKPHFVLSPARIALEGASLHEAKAPELREVLRSFVVDQEAGRITFYPQHAAKTSQTEPTTFEITNESHEGKKFAVYRLKDHPDRIIKVPRQAELNELTQRQMLGQLTSLLQVAERQDILDKHHTPHLKIHETDPAGPPYRYVIQDALPEGAVSVADLIKSGQLGEAEIKEICDQVTRYESDKQYQLDTNPFAWFRVTGENGKTRLLYASGKVYPYDDKWEFRKMGLLQWMTPKYLEESGYFFARLPKKDESQALALAWQNPDAFSVWKKYLPVALQPVVEPESTLKIKGDDSEKGDDEGGEVGAQTEN